MTARIRALPARCAALIATGLCIVVSLAEAQSRPPRAPTLATPGCWRFDRPLGSSAVGNVEGDDPAWRLIAFRSGGGVSLPSLETARSREMWERRSGWRVEGDSLRAVVSTGLAGWRLVLRQKGSDRRTRVGNAYYLSDVVVNGRPYTETYPVVATRASCPAGFDARTVTRSGWNFDSR